MFRVFKTAWQTPELRKKILFTLMLMVIFRIGSAITVPFLDIDAVRSWVDSNATDGNFLEYMNVITGGALSNATLLSLSITPYINASIIMQLLTYALPPLEALQKEGETGRQTLNRITMVVSMVLSAFMSYAYYLTLRNKMGAVEYTTGFAGWFTGAVIVLCFMAGAATVVWFGNRVTEKGVGNGVSIMLFTGIVARYPVEVGVLWDKFVNDKAHFLWLMPAVALIFISMVGLVVLFNQAERRIPIQYAKRVVGNKQYGGQSTHMPIKVIGSGVMPIIFAMSFMALPTSIQMFAGPPDPTNHNFYYWFSWAFSMQNWPYAIMYMLLIVAFNYFYVSMQYNPVEIANRLRQNNGAVPGIRSGKPTEIFIRRVLSKLTLVGAIFLGFIAIFPIFFSKIDGLESIYMGGTSLLIVVNVALMTARTLESQMMMRHHKGFLE
ncbi:MAG: preprotein translocase subunit SecY [Ruminococcus sp.]|nr:preprotein translocase subunit SecY [Ruminococcus sp.]